MDDQAGISRRKALGRVAAVGAAAWTAPMILSSTAYAAGSLADNVCADVGRPQSLTYTYTGGCAVWDGCNLPGDDAMEDKRTPTTLLGCNPGDIQLVVSRQSTGTIYNGTVSVGDQFTLSPLKPGQPDVVFDLTSVTTGATAQMTVHTSCSQALCVGDKHGYFVVSGYS